MKHGCYYIQIFNQHTVITMEKRKTTSTLHIQTLTLYCMNSTTLVSIQQHPAQLKLKFLLIIGNSKYL